MAKALGLVSRPDFSLDPVTIQTRGFAQAFLNDDVRHLCLGHDEIQRLTLQTYNSGSKRPSRINIRAHVLDAVFEDSIDRTPTFTLSIHDPDWELLNLGVVDGHVIDINPGRIPHRWYRLDAVNVVDDDITLTFATRNAVYLEYHDRPMKANRKKITRAQFILRMVREVKKVRIPFNCPELNVIQPIARTDFGSTRSRSRSHKPGFTPTDKLTVGGHFANQKQRDTMAQVVQAGMDRKAPYLVIVAAIMTVDIESACGTFTTGNPPYVGAFQQNRGDGWPGTGNVYRDAVGNGSLGRKQGGFYGWAIPIYRQNPNTDLGFFVATVQGVVGSTNPLNSGYSQKANSHRDEAQHAVNAFGGVDKSDGTGGFAQAPGTKNIKLPYEFDVGVTEKDETYLAATYRLAEEVQWNAFWVKDELNVVAQWDLFKKEAAVRIRRFEQGVETISFDWDRGEPLIEMRLGVRMDRWICPIGTVVVFDEGGPAQGRWLVTNIRRSLYSQLGEVILRKPIHKKREIANAPGTKNITPVGKEPHLPSQVQMGDGGIEDLKNSWTPRQIIERLVIPKAVRFGMSEGSTIANMMQVNAGGHTAGSWHYGPANIQWAIDMSNGFHPTPEMDDLASNLISSFNMPDLANPFATSGSVPGNLLNSWGKGFHFVLIYRTFLASGGNHYNHIHFGVKREGPPFRESPRAPSGA